MGNIEPRKSRDYRDVKKPNLYTRAVLIWLYESKQSKVTGRQVEAHFGLDNPSEGTVRLSRLKAWGCVRITERGYGPHPHKYDITPWGKHMAKKWAKEADRDEAE